jgi:hypothetical protein
VKLLEAARPLSIVITNRDGEHYGIKYDIEERNLVYDQTSSIIGEALGSIASIEEISEDDWRKALSGPGVYFEYTVPIKLSVLNGWLDAHMPDTVKDVPIRRIYVAFGEDKSRIYYQDIGSDLFFGADTASAAGKLQALEKYDANDAVFAFETDIQAAQVAPYMLIMKNIDHFDVSVGSVSREEELLDMVIIALGHGEEIDTTYAYRDSKNVLNCVGAQFNIKVNTDGKVFYRRTDLPPHGVEEHIKNASEMIERARDIVANTIGKECGDAEVFFESENISGDSGLVTFGYYIAGGRMYLQQNVHAAQVRFSAGMVTDVVLVFRKFLITEERINLLPEKQTFAAAGGEFLLCYSDAGLEMLEPSWIRVGES